MTKKLLSVPWNHSMKKAWRLMKDAKVRHLPVIGEDGKLIGILSDRDVNRAMDPNSPSFAEKAVVADYMNWPVLTVRQEAPITEVLDAMIEKKISALVVTEGSVPVGIATSEDMLRLLRDSLEKRPKGKALTLLDFRYLPFLQEAMREADAAGL